MKTEPKPEAFSSFSPRYDGKDPLLSQTSTAQATTPAPNSSKARKQRVRGTHPLSPSGPKSRPKNNKRSAQVVKLEERSSKNKRPRSLSLNSDQRASLSSHEMEVVDELLASTGLSTETVVSLINNQADKDQVQKESGFSRNYIMALQRKVLRSSKTFQLRQPERHKIGNHWIHVLFHGDHKTPLFIRKELFTCLSMSGTCFSYWRKRAKVEEIDTSMDIRLM